MLLVLTTLEGWQLQTLKSYLCLETRVIQFSTSRLSSCSAVYMYGNMIELDVFVMYSNVKDYIYKSEYSNGLIFLIRRTGIKWRWTPLRIILAH